MKKLVIAVVCIAILGLIYSFNKTAGVGNGGHCRCTNFTARCMMNAATINVCVPDEIEFPRCWDYHEHCEAPISDILAED